MVELNNIDIYTIKNCSKCQKVKEFLNKMKLVYIEHDMGQGGNPELQQMKKQFKEWGLKTYPVTIVEDDWQFDKYKRKKILQGFDEKEFEEAFGGI